MEGASEMKSYFRDLKGYAKGSPLFTLFASCALLLVLTRLWTGLMKARLQNKTGPPEKSVPVLPYWLPYIGHALSFAWSFDDTLAWGRSALPSI